MGLEKIAELKKRLGLTTEELSIKSEVPIGTLNKILSGQTKDPKLGTLKSIARVLGCPLNAFDDVENEALLYNEVEYLIAKNGSQMTETQKLRLIQLLSEDEDSFDK